VFRYNTIFAFYSNLYTEYEGKKIVCLTCNVGIILYLARDNVIFPFIEARDNILPRTTKFHLLISIRYIIPFIWFMSHNITADVRVLHKIILIVRRDTWFADP
jgi:hypothetical protein